MNKHKRQIKTRIIFTLLIITSLLFLILSSSIQINAAIPLQRYGHAIIYDSSDDRIILFGGATDNNIDYITFDTWSYDYNTNEWKELITEQTPYGAYGAKMAYDSESDKIILFGGTIGSAQYVLLDETWVFDYAFNNWTLMPIPETTTGTPLLILPVVTSLGFLAVLVIIQRKIK
ncbi:MAG: Kelch repeat-containing protein [Candidatus Heimdallarchaeaceae archaeon]